jgi:putative transposase
MIVAYRYRVKSLNGLLDAIKWGRKWLTGFELCNLTAGSSKELGILATTINMVCLRYAKSRLQHNRPYLRYRGKKSLGWIPVKGCDLYRHGDAFRFARNTFRVFNSRPLPEGKIKDGTNFSQDAKGNWFLNIVIEVADAPAREIKAGVGIDLGLKDFATFSTGEKIDNPRHFRELEEKLAIANRANKRRQAANIHARIANARRDFHHKLSTRIVREFDYIAVGNVNAARLVKTSMAKSVNDAGWSSFRDMLRYKAIAHGAAFEEVNEVFTTVTCSACGSRSGPKATAGLRIREWVCSDCGTEHDRDTNAALNILRLGHQALAGGTNGQHHWKCQIEGNSQAKPRGEG